MFIYTLIKLEPNQCGTQDYSLIGTYKSLKDTKEIAEVDALVDALSEDLEVSKWERVIGEDDNTEYMCEYKSKYYSCTYKVHQSILVG